jgi:hypothetical protein
MTAANHQLLLRGNDENDKPVMPGKTAGCDPESRNQNTGFPPARE